MIRSARLTCSIEANSQTCIPLPERRLSEQVSSGKLPAFIVKLINYTINRSSYHFVQLEDARNLS